MINSNYVISNDLSHIVPGDTVWDTKHGHCKVIKLCLYDKPQMLQTEHGYYDLNGRDSEEELPQIFDSIVSCINYFTYYQHYMTNDRNLDPNFK